MVQVTVLLLILGIVNAGECPGSPAFVHAKTKVTARCNNPCSPVRNAVNDRIGGRDGWKDPNGGRYQMNSAGMWSVDVTRTSADGSTVDKIKAGFFWHTSDAFFHVTSLSSFIQMSFSSDGTGCIVTACSETQATSITDNSRNFCNM